MSLLLSIETSTSVCSVAVHEEGRLLELVQTEIPQSASSQLAVMIKQALDAIGKSPNQLQGVTVAAGPGSYTGLRIGVATAKGICYALQVPLLSINTLELLAYQFSLSSSLELTINKFEKDEMNFRNTENLTTTVTPLLGRGAGGEVLKNEFSGRSPGGEALCPMLDARRMEVYCMLLDSDLASIEPTQAKVIDTNSFSDILTQRPIYFFGDGALKCQEIIKHPNAHFVPGLIPSAAQLGELGFQKWKSKEFEDVASFEPFYLKDFMIKKPNLV